MVKKLPSSERLAEALMERKGLLISLVALVVATPLVIGTVRYFLGKKEIRDARHLYNFETGPFAGYQEKKLKGEEFAARLRDLRQKLGNARALSARLAIYADEMMSQSDLAEAEELLLAGNKKAKNPYIQFLLRLRLATVYEDTGRPQLAIETIKTMLDAKVRPMEDKLRLDLGRLYLEQHRQDLAKKSFDWVLEHSQDGEFLKLARLFKERLK